MASVDIRNVRKAFGSTQVLHGVSVGIEDGQFVVLVGPSGCGKSTLLRMLAGLENITAGEIAIGGKVVNNVPPKDRDIAMVFQNYALYPHMTVFENMAFSLKLAGAPKEFMEQEVQKAARILGLGQLLHRYPRQLSGGQRQRVAMGRAIVRNPQVFLFDEPLSNLDAKLRVEMRMEIKQLHQRIRSTIVYVTHDQIEAMTMATRIAVMNQGEVQQFADPDTVYNRPANLFVARFMGAPPMNTLPARLEGAQGALRAVVGRGEAAVSLPLPAALAARAQAGREVVLGLRPECIAEQERRFGGEDGERLVLDLPVEMTEPTGAETIVLARLGGERTLARVAPDMRPEPGGSGRFALDMRRACLFDPATGALIA